MTLALIRAADVSRHLGDAGHEHAEWDDPGGQQAEPANWTHGYRSQQAGPCRVHTRHTGPDPQRHLDLYALALRNLGYIVEPAVDDDGRPYLVITKERT